MSVLRARLKADQRGFTLTEVLVTIMMMIVVLFALYSIFDMGIRVFSFGNDKLEAVENARVGLERMEREIRAAYPQSGSPLFNIREADRISFRNQEDSGSPTPITYELSSGSPTTLLKNSQPVIENVSALDFAYCNTPSTCSGVTEENTKLVRVTLEVMVEGGPQDGTQTLTTYVYLRNRP